MILKDFVTEFLPYERQQAACFQMFSHLILRKKKSRVARDFLPSQHIVTLHVIVKLWTERGY